MPGPGSSAAHQRHRVPGPASTCAARSAGPAAPDRVRACTARHGHGAPGLRAAGDADRPRGRAAFTRQRTSRRRGPAPPTPYLFVRARSWRHRRPSWALAIVGPAHRPARRPRHRFRQIVLESKARRESSLLSRQRLRRGAAGRALHRGGLIDEQIGGVAGLQAVRDLADAVEHDWSSCSRLARAPLSWCAAAIAANVTLGSDAQPALMPALADLLASLPEGGVLRPSHGRRPPYLSAVSPCPARSTTWGKRPFCTVQAGPCTIRPGDQCVPEHDVAVGAGAQGGAHGAHGGLDLLSGLYTYTSYRDPNVLRTLTTTTGRPTSCAASPDEDEVTKAVIALPAS